MARIAWYLSELSASPRCGAGPRVGSQAPCPRLAAKLGAGSEPGLLVPPPELPRDQALLPTEPGRAGHRRHTRGAARGQRCLAERPTPAHPYAPTSSNQTARRRTNPPPSLPGLGRELKARISAPACVQKAPLFLSSRGSRYLRKEFVQHTLIHCTCRHN